MALFCENLTGAPPLHIEKANIICIFMDFNKKLFCGDMFTRYLYY
jgi:hypothetical protein